MISITIPLKNKIEKENNSKYIDHLFDVGENHRPSTDRKKRSGGPGRGGRANPRKVSARTWEADMGRAGSGSRLMARLSRQGARKWENALESAGKRKLGGAIRYMDVLEGARCCQKVLEDARSC